MTTPAACIAIAIVLVVVSGSKSSPPYTSTGEASHQVVSRAGVSTAAAIVERSAPTPSLQAKAPACGDGVCEPPENLGNCMADCPGVTTPDTCGEEPHSDVGGYAVVWGAGHRKATAAECCDACAKHAADPKNAKRPCNRCIRKASEPWSHARC